MAFEHFQIIDNSGCKYKPEGYIITVIIITVYLSPEIFSFLSATFLMATAWLYKTTLMPTHEACLTCLEFQRDLEG